MPTDYDKYFEAIKAEVERKKVLEKGQSPKKKYKAYLSAKDEEAPKKLDRRKFFLYLLLVLTFIFCTWHFFRSSPQQPRTKTENPVKVEQHETIAIPSKSTLPQVAPEKSPVIPRPATRARLILESRNDADIVRVLAEGPEKTAYIFEWTKNGAPAGTGDSISGFRRGDKLSVKITPYNGKEYGQSRILTTEIKNTLPKVVENKEIKFDGKLLTYQVKAYDPDEDVLSYSLVEGPENMTIDTSSGVIKWEIQDKDKGKRSVKVKISDGHGGEVIYVLDIDLDLLREGK
jgi:hypothetical protein